MANFNNDDLVFLKRNIRNASDLPAAAIIVIEALIEDLAEARTKIAKGYLKSLKGEKR